MEKDKITMSQSQLNRYDIISKAIAGFITIKEASQALGISARQVKRLKKAVREKDAQGVIHGNTAKPSANRLPDHVRATILKLYREKYQNSNFKHFQEILSEYHSIEISYAALHGLLAREGIKSPKTRRRFKPHRRRARRPQAGLMIQVDATPYRWFKGDRKMYSLHGCIDDATSQVTALYMCRNECLHGYFETLRMTIQTFGVPQSLYADRHTIFQSPNTKKHEIDSSVPVNDTQFGRCLKELSITLIGAKSPQAKGRIERLWGTLQSRLPVEFVMRGIASLEAANEFLKQYVYAFNSNFAVEPRNAQNAFRKLRADENLDHVLCVKEKRVVDAGGVFSYGGRSFQIVHTGTMLPAKSQIDVLVSANAGIMASFKGRVFQVLPFVSPKRRVQSAEPKEPRRHSPPPDHAWRAGLKQHGAPFWKYEGEDEDAYRETVRVLENALLGGRR
ncbi:MAG: ISNCY family transposase [Gracilibacteraceae bacterium]|nr:ISNCY family transposase [Gracilibacteraceae bacterium]